MKKFKRLFIILCGILIWSSANAGKHIDQVTMGVATKDMKRGHPIVSPAREIVLEYMLKNGDITQAEIEERKRQKDALREELRTLKNAGDKAAFKARLEELKEDHHKRRAEYEAYIKNNAQLKEKLEQQKKRTHRKHKYRKDDLRSKLKHHLKDEE